MSDRGGIGAEFCAESPERRRATIVLRFGVAALDVPIQGLRERAGLDGADAHDAKSTRFRGGDDLARHGRLGEVAHAAGAVEEVCDSLDDVGRRVVADRLSDRRRHADAGDTPGPDAAARLKPLHSRGDFLDIGPPRRREAILVGVVARIDVVVRPDIAVEEEDVDVLETHGPEAGVQRRLEPRGGLLGWRAAELTFGRDPDASRRRAGEGLTDDLFAVEVHRRCVDEVDPRLDRGQHGRYRFPA